MTESGNTVRTLAVRIVPVIDVEEFKRRMQDAMSQVGASTGSQATGSAHSTDTGVVLNSLSEIKELLKKIAGGSSGGGTAGSTTKADKKQGTSKSDADKNADLVMNILNKGLSTLFTAVKQGFGIVQQLYGRIKQSSQFLQTVENMFNLAMSLLFLPLGNALATVILPAAVDLVDAVIGLWDEMDEVFDGSGGKLGSILSIILDKGLDYFADFFNKIADEMGESKGIIGDIAALIDTIGNFIRNGLATTLVGILTGIGVVMTHLKEFISLYIAFKAVEAVSSMTGIFGELTGTDGAIKLAATAAIAGGSTYGILAGLGMASGGYVPATDGGELHILGEGGEGEYVIPESKLGAIGGNNIVNNFYGYTTEELRFTVRDTIRDEITRTRYTRGF